MMKVGVYADTEFSDAPSFLHTPVVKILIG